MYQNYFGFKERPFQLVPNPAYLFLSRSHEEAMAHLTYAVSEGDGFISIIGEVGTGKTTLCRAFIESLDDRREVAYIFNPKLTAVELLEAVCDEFDIRGPKDGTTKDLIDTINRFLLDKKAEGKQVMLIIDEAQNLSREVLEQLRLLSNLETNTEKLLQIVLAGQPELDEMLESYELRQLSQRITLCCHLTPLTFSESVQYIHHRIRIAARNQGVAFTQTAFRKIHAFSGGIPRLIHIVCDRALLTAYVMNREKITGPIVESAIRELSPQKDLRKLRILEKRKTVLLAALLCLLVVMFFLAKPMNFGITHKTDAAKTFKISTAMQKGNPPAASRTEPPAESGSVDAPMPESMPGPSEPAITPPVPERLEPDRASVVPASRLSDFLTALDAKESKKTALSSALSLWGVPLPIQEYPEKELVDPETYYNLTSRKNGFLVHRTQCSNGEILKLNLPAIFEFTIGDRLGPYFLTLSRIREEALTFETGTADGAIEVSLEDVERFWTGFVYIPWNNFFEYEGVTPLSGDEKDIRTLKEILGNAGYHHLSPDAVYDPETRSVVKEIQQRYGIPVDGLVGPLTKMALYNELPELGIPHIREDSGDSRSMEPAN